MSCVSFSSIRASVPPSTTGKAWPGSWWARSGADAARAGAAAEVQPLVDELCRLSPEFKAMWRDNDVRSHGEGVKQIRHPVLGAVAFEFSAFTVDGRPDLSMVVYNPATPAEARRSAR